MENCGWAIDLASTLEYPFRVFRFSLQIICFVDICCAIFSFIHSITFSVWTAIHYILDKWSLRVHWIIPLLFMWNFFLYKTEAEILHRNPFGFCCLLSFSIICFQISLLRISDPILYLRKDFLSLRFSDQNICETIFICTLDCPFRLEFYMPFVSGSQIGFVLTIYEKVLKNISIRNFLKVFNCHTKKPWFFWIWICINSFQIFWTKSLILCFKWTRLWIHVFCIPTCLNSNTGSFIS